MTNIRICECMDKWKDKIKCKVVLVKCKTSTQKTL
jgi:hypothetical protein